LMAAIWGGLRWGSELAPWHPRLGTLVSQNARMPTQISIATILEFPAARPRDPWVPRHARRAQFRNDVTSWWRGHALDISRRSRRSSAQGCRPNPQPMERILAQNLLVRRDDRGPSYHYTARSSTSFGNHTRRGSWRRTSRPGRSSGNHLRRQPQSRWGRASPAR
jgi:hypothetical protein